MPKNASILASSRDPNALTNAAVELAVSEDPADQLTLAGLLNSSQFLLRLNTAQEYNTSRPRALRVAKVLNALRESDHAAPQQTLLRLALGGDFVDENWLRQELLVRALVNIRPAPPEAIRYWDTQSAPTAVNRHITIEMLCDNGSDPAMELLEKKLLDPEQEPEYKVAWIHDSMLRHRNDAPLLRASERMIKQTLPPDLRLVLLEALCSYDASWYPGCEKPKPPPRLEASPEAREILRQICLYARDDMELPPKLEAAVRATLAEIGHQDSASSPPEQSS